MGTWLVILHIIIAFIIGLIIGFLVAKKFPFLFKKGIISELIQSDKIKKVSITERSIMIEYKKNSKE